MYTKVEKRTKQTASNLMDDGTPARRFKWVVEIEVDEVWVADGFDLTQDRLKSIIERELSYADFHETDCRIIRTPDPKTIREAQGYATA